MTSLSDGVHLMTLTVTDSVGKTDQDNITIRTGNTAPGIDGVRIEPSPLYTLDDAQCIPEGWADDALCRAETRQRYRELVFLGLTDALRVFNRQSHLYTFWDYQGGAWQKDNGLRIDHLLLSPQAADRLSASGVDRGPRNKEKPSDHTPVWCELEDGG